MNFLLQRLREPSSWAGIAALIAAGSQAVTTKDANAIGACVAGVLSFLMPEKGAK